MDGLAWIGQDAFTAGAWPLQEKVPRNGVEDLVDGLFDDDASIFKRGGSAYKGNAFAAALRGIYDLQLGGGQRTLVSSATQLFELAADDTTPFAVSDNQTQFTPGGAIAQTFPGRRASVVNGMMVVPRADATSPRAGGFYFAGSRKAPGASYSAGTVSVTQGSTTVTGAGGTAWLANVDAGMILQLNLGAEGEHIVAVASVESDTSLTLARPWVASSQAGAAYTLNQSYVTASGLALPVAGNFYFAVAGDRLWYAHEGASRIKFSYAGAPNRVDKTDYHALPDGRLPIGLEAVHDRLMIFTTDGLYLVGNTEYDLTDALGNTQQTLSRYADQVLWHDNGIADWKGAAIVPCTDDVYLMDGEAPPVGIGGPVRKLLRSYVKAGYTLGLAHVAQGHYILPVLNGAAWVDTLICRLDTRAWSRTAGFSGKSVGFATRVASDATRTEKLFAVNGTRLVDCTGWFAPAAGNKLEADGSTHNIQVTLRTVQRSTAGETLRKMRVRYELDDAAADNPTITAEIAVGCPGSAFTALAGSGPENTGQTPHVWTKVNKSGSAFRVRLTSVGPSASLVLRSVELAFRPTGAQ